MQKEQKNFIVNVKIYIDYVNGPRSIFKGSFWILFQLNGMYLLDKSIKMLPTSYPSEPPGEQEEVWREEDSRSEFWGVPEQTERVWADEISLADHRYWPCTILHCVKTNLLGF